MKPIVHEVVYPHPVERVWRALTEPETLARWLMANDFAPEVGREFRFHSTPQRGWDGTVHGTVTEVDPPRRLVYSWLGGANASGEPTTVAWTLVPTSVGTRLRLEHSGFRGLQGFLVRGILERGWKRKILREALPQALRELESGVAAVAEEY